MKKVWPKKDEEASTKKKLSSEKKRRNFFPVLREATLFFPVPEKSYFLTDLRNETSFVRNLFFYCSVIK